MSELLVEYRGYIQTHAVLLGSVVCGAVGGGQPIPDVAKVDRSEYPGL